MWQHLLIYKCIMHSKCYILTSYWNLKFLPSLAAAHQFEMKQHTRVHKTGNCYGNNNCVNRKQSVPCFGIFFTQIKLFLAEI